MALVTVSRIDELSGNMRTECVRNIKGLLETESKKNMIEASSLPIWFSFPTFYVGILVGSMDQ